MRRLLKLLLVCGVSKDKTIELQGGENAPRRVRKARDRTKKRQAGNVLGMDRGAGGEGRGGDNDLGPLEGPAERSRWIWYVPVDRL